MRATLAQNNAHDRGLPVTLGDLDVDVQEPALVHLIPVSQQPTDAAEPRIALINPGSSAKQASRAREANGLDLGRRTAKSMHAREMELFPGLGLLQKALLVPWAHVHDECRGTADEGGASQDAQGQTAASSGGNHGGCGGSGGGGSHGRHERLASP